MEKKIKKGYITDMNDIYCSRCRGHTAGLYHSYVSKI